ncbi:FAD-binding oxidoreductase [Hamadaea tsunoensis]|uniref:FAD-binding oxidoreductase n=1 Tax=Hamadaea tsunoensis TaxID=53368 RepID=UPI0003F6FCFF|nr:FAD-binding oxidoreductase [Hamadaea tsunoensis]
MTSSEEILRRDFGGDIIEPDAEAYAAARGSVFVDGSPAYVLRPNSVDDVRVAVRFAAAAGLPLSVRGGGHAFPGFATNDGGIVIDLGALAEIEIGGPVAGGPVVVGSAVGGSASGGLASGGTASGGSASGGGRLVRVGGGANWGQVTAALAPHGLAISAGDTRNVGVGGLTLSGGIGWKVRKYGLALDNVVAAEIVTADGQVRTASATENPDLFWAIRGGGGNFGIVTAFTFVAHRTTDVHFGRITFPATEAVEVLDGWAAYLREAPVELTSIIMLGNPFAGGPAAPVEVMVAYDGDDPAAAAAAIAPVRALGTVLSDQVERKAYADILVDAMTPPPGIQLVTRSAFVDPKAVSSALPVITDVASAPGTPYFAIRSVGGAVSQVADDATAYAYRQAELMLSTTTLGPAPAIEAAKPVLAAFWDRLDPHMAGAYANFLSTADEKDVAAVYPPATYERLASVKRRYDPENLFARNHNVRPQ